MGGTGRAGLDILGELGVWVLNWGAGLGVLVLWVLNWEAGLDILGELLVWVLNWEGCRC